MVPISTDKPASFVNLFKKNLSSPSARCNDRDILPQQHKQLTWFNSNSSEFVVPKKRKLETLDVFSDVYDDTNISKKQKIAKAMAEFQLLKIDRFSTQDSTYSVPTSAKCESPLENRDNDLMKFLESCNYDADNSNHLSYRAGTTDAKSLYDSNEEAIDSNRDKDSGIASIPTLTDNALVHPDTYVNPPLNKDDVVSPKIYDLDMLTYKLNKGGPDNVSRIGFDLMMEDTYSGYENMGFSALYDEKLNPTDAFNSFLTGTKLAENSNSLTINPTLLQSSENTDTLGLSSIQSWETDYTSSWYSSSESSFGSAFEEGSFSDGSFNGCDLLNSLSDSGIEESFVSFAKPSLVSNNSLTKKVDDFIQQEPTTLIGQLNHFIAPEDRVEVMRKSLEQQLIDCNANLNELGFKLLETNKSEFNCSLCDFKSARRQQVYRHSTSHLPKKPFSCSFCSAVFNRSDSAMRHASRCKS